MSRKPLALTVFAVSLLVLAIAASTLAQGGPPPPDATPGAPGVAAVVLSGLDPAAAPGRGMEMREFTWEPGSYVTPHTHPAAFIICVEEGALGFSIGSGAAVVTRAGSDGAEATSEQMEVGVEVVLEPRDCVAVDDAPPVIHTAWNASDQTTVTIETYLFARDEPGRTFVDADGTPIPQ